MSGLKVNVYKVLEDSVEIGIEGGWNRAFKHTDTPPEHVIKEEILRYVMLQISENFIFDETNT